MSVKLIGKDVEMMRYRYDEALKMQGIACLYQYPVGAKTDENGQPLIEAYSEIQSCDIFFEGNPKVKTFKRYGWVVENDSQLPFLIHCSWNLQNVQKDSIFRIEGQYTGLPERVFRVTEITYDIQCPDHIVCQVVPCYEDQLVGRTHKEVEKTYNKSNHFLQQPTDYRGQYMTEQKGDK